MKIIQRFSNLKIGWKLGILFGMIIIFGWLNGALFFYVSSIMEMEGRVINVAGRQRMLTQKMTKEAYPEDDKRIGAF